jgi:hypothetical protein
MNMLEKRRHEIMKTKKPKVTEILHHLGEEDLPFGAVNPPIFQTSIFSFKTFADFKNALKDEKNCYIYSPLWRKIQADIYQVPLYQVRVDEGPAFGAALLAAVGKGVFPNVEQACQKAVKVMDKVYPDSQKGIRYNEIYQIYKDLYPALKPFYKRISNISW